MSLTGYTDQQARRADIAAQIVGVMKFAVANFGFGSNDARKAALALVEQYEATFTDPDKPEGDA